MPRINSIIPETVWIKSSEMQVALSRLHNVSNELEDMGVRIGVQFDFSIFNEMIARLIKEHKPL
jgi:hypothetical protein